MTRPTVFRDLPFEAAQAASRAEDRLLLVSVTSASSIPCRQMDHDAWSDPSVGGWLALNAVAIQVGPDSPVAAALEIMSLPTVVAWRDGEELDRISDARPANLLLDWLDGLLTGRLDLDRLLATTRRDLRTRLQLAEALARHSRPEEALAEFLQLWRLGAAESDLWTSHRRPLLVPALRSLVQSHAPTREAFSGLREEARSRLPGRAALQDFVALTDLLDDRSSVLTWFEQINSESAIWESAARIPDFIDLVDRAGGWERMGQHLRDPVKQLQEHYATLVEALKQAPSELPPAGLEEARTILMTSLRMRAAWLRRCLMAARRHEDASTLVREARRLDPSEAMTQALRR